MSTSLESPSQKPNHPSGMSMIAIISMEISLKNLKYVAIVRKLNEDMPMVTKIAPLILMRIISFFSAGTCIESVS
ncbi:MAG: hypothetical protein JRI81_16375 [Deltaproteobacteria bacterium]|nr:hypothetical protein [Deltaproteobacteria bacterium]